MTLGGKDDGDDDGGDDEDDAADRRFNFNFFKLMVVLLVPALAETAGVVLEADKSCSCEGRFLGMVGSTAAEATAAADEADGEEALWLLPLPPLPMLPNPAFRGIVPINDDDDAEEDGEGRVSLLRVLLVAVGVAAVVELLFLGILNELESIPPLLLDPPPDGAGGGFWLLSIFFSLCGCGYGCGCGCRVSCGD